MRTAAVLLIAISMARATDPEITAIARRIASVQARLPWFGPPDAEGMPDVPYAREERIKRSRPRGRGPVVTDWASITFKEHCKTEPLAASTAACSSTRGPRPDAALAFEQIPLAWAFG